MPSMSRLARVSRPSYSLTPFVNIVATFKIIFRCFHRMDELLECAAVELRRTHEGEYGYPPRSSIGGGGNDKDFPTAANGAGSFCVVQSKALVEELLEFRWECTSHRVLLLFYGVVNGFDVVWRSIFL